MSISNLKVNGLHKDRDIDINFHDNVKIILAGNGAGKTTIINILVGILSGKSRKLRYIEFDCIVITFNSGEILELRPEDLVLLSTYSAEDLPASLKALAEHIGDEAFNNLILVASETPSRAELMRTSEFIDADPYYMGPSVSFAEELLDFAKQGSMSLEDKNRQMEIKATIDRNFPFSSIYLPTYRRVEEDLKNLGFDLNERRHFGSAQGKEINFGMKDVEERIKQFTEAIRRSTVREYQTKSARMLGQLAKNVIPTIDSLRGNLARSHDLELMLSRLASVISADEKTLITNLVKNGEIFGDDRKTLAFLLSNLIEIYDETKIRDEQIKAFVEAIKHYEWDKYFHYDEINVKLELRSVKDDLPIQLPKLSSGEKQLISILSNIYLRPDEGRKIAVFIDEPELSLSVEWQREFLPDIMNSERCGFLFAATHSPFIFDNSLEKYVEAMKVTYR